MKANLGWVEAREFSLRSAGNTLSGHAALYDSLSSDLGGFVEIIRPGAFRDVLKDDVVALINHDPNLLLARTRSGTLSIRDDGRGLAFAAELSQATYAQDLRIAMGRGDINRCSVSFDVGLDRWTYQPAGVLLREILSFSQLWDVSVVVYPAYPATDAGLRNGAAGEAWKAEAAGRRLDLFLVELGMEPQRAGRPQGLNLSTGNRRRQQPMQEAVREHAVDSPRAVKRSVVDAMAGTRCSCGAPSHQLTINHRSGSIEGRCSRHEATHPASMSERQRQLAVIERELRS